jgi:hypothetical protein
MVSNNKGGIEHKNKLLVPKWDSLHKHVSRKKVNRPMKGAKKGECYINNDCKHNKNQVAYAFKGKKSILQKVSNGLVGEKRKKLV